MELKTGKMEASETKISRPKPRRDKRPMHKGVKETTKKKASHHSRINVRCTMKPPKQQKGFIPQWNKRAMLAQGKYERSTPRYVALYNKRINVYHFIEKRTDGIKRRVMRRFDALSHNVHIVNTSTPVEELFKAGVRLRLRASLLVSSGAHTPPLTRKSKIEPCATMTII